jgi:hypothetical protein
MQGTANIPLAEPSGEAMKAKTAMHLIATAFLLTPMTSRADEASCVAKRFQAAGKYASCEAKAAANEFNDAGFLKCRHKLATTWEKLGTKNPGTSCDVARFADNGNTVTDNMTQLVWDKKTTALGSGSSADPHDVDISYTWSAVSTSADGTAFTDYLAALNTAGFEGQHDWRLPTAYELQTILATDALPCATPPCVADALFLPAQSDFYLSSTTDLNQATVAFYVNFTSGYTVNGLVKTESRFVRAVRGGF